MRRFASRIVVAAFLLAGSTAAPATDEKERDEALSRLQERIDRQVDQYKKKRIAYVTGWNAGSYQDYVNSCLTKILDEGNRNYPQDAKGRLYGTVQVSFSVAASGELEKAEVSRSSGFGVLDDVIVKAVRLAAPFGAFPSDMKARIATLAITQSFTFAKDGTRAALRQKED